MRMMFLALFACLSFNLFAIHVDLRSYSFYGSQPYTEFYIRIDGKTIEWQDKQAVVDILLLISDENSNIVAYDKFELTLTDEKEVSDLLEVKRFHIPKGTYTVRVEATDKNKEPNKIELEQRLLVTVPNDDFILSDIVPLAVFYPDSSQNSLVKNGFYMEPLAYHFVSENRKEFNFYIEVYHQLDQKADQYFLQYSIMDGTTKNIETKKLLTRYRKLSGSDVEPMVVKIGSDVLASGDYHILAEIVNKEKTVFATSTCDFVVSNPKADLARLEALGGLPQNAFVKKVRDEDMDYCMKALIPIAAQNQMGTIEELIKSKDLDNQRLFLYNFWLERSPKSPKEAFNAYMEVVDAVEKKFYDNTGYGFQTDRGYIFLKYGKPSSVLSIDDEVDAPPYEIWYYNSMPATSQTNVRFLFYNPTLVHNNMILLHSTCIGERSNPAWEVELYKSVPMEREGNSVDGKTVGPNWNRNARKYFNEF